MGYVNRICRKEQREAFLGDLSCMCVPDVIFY